MSEILFQATKSAYYNTSVFSHLAQLMDLGIAFVSYKVQDRGRKRLIVQHIKYNTWENSMFLVLLHTY